MIETSDGVHFIGGPHSSGKIIESKKNPPRPFIVKPIEVNLNRTMKTVTAKIKITNVKEMKFKLWIAGKLFRLGARIMNCKIDIEFKKESKK